MSTLQKIGQETCVGQFWQFLWCWLFHRNQPSRSVFSFSTKQTLLTLAFPVDGSLTLWSHVNIGFYNLHYHSHLRQAHFFSKQNKENSFETDLPFFLDNKSGILPLDHKVGVEGDCKVKVWHLQVELWQNHAKESVNMAICCPQPEVTLPTVG